MNTSKLLKRMVEIYSPSGDESALVDFLQPEMEGFGFETERDSAGNLIGRTGSGNPEILLLGHLDTVRGEIPVKIEDGKLYGRGSVDAKGPLANFIASASGFSDSDNLSLTVVGVVEEESSSRGAYEIVDSISPDFVVIGEPSSWDGITLGYRGSTRIDFHLGVEKSHRGKSASRPAEEAIKFYRKLKDRFADGSSGFNSTEIRLTKIRTGDDPFQDDVRMVLDVRTSLDFEPKVLDEFIETNGGKAKIDRTREIPPVRTSKKNKLVSSLLAAIRGAGGRPRFKLKTGTADMNILADRWDVPIVAYGPGDSSLDHTPNEHLDLEELARAEEVLTGAIENLENSLGNTSVSQE